MKKKLLSMAVAAAMTAPFAVQAENTVYGKVHVSVDYVDAELAGGLFDWPNLLDPWPFAGVFPGTPFGGTDLLRRGRLAEGDQDLWQVESRSTRLGVKGSEDLGNGLKAVYKMEFQIDIDGDSGTGVQSLRNAYGGLSHATFGTVVAGRHDTPYKMTFAKWDRFVDAIADDDRIFGAYKGGGGGNSPVALGPQFGGRGLVHRGAAGLSRVTGFSDVRADNVVAYISPEFAGLTFTGATIAGETNEDDSINSAGWAVGLSGKWGPVKGGLAYEELALTEYSAPFWGGVFEDDDTKWGAAIAWDQKPFYVGLRYEDRENVGGLKGMDVQQYQLAAEFHFGNNVLKALYQDLDSDMPWNMGYLDWEADAWAVGIDHKFSKRTKLYALYMETENDLSTPLGLSLPVTTSFFGDTSNTAAAVRPNIGLPASITGVPRDVDAFSLGMVHKF